MSIVPTALTRAAAVGALVALVVTVAGPAYADKPNVGVTPDGPNGAVVTGSNTTTHTSPGHSGSTGSTGSTGTTPTSYGSSSPAAPPPPPTWEQMMDKDPNADLSTMPGAVDSCGSDWGGDGWNAQYAQPTPCAPTDDPKPGQPPAPPRVHFPALFTQQPAIQRLITLTRSCHAGIMAFLPRSGGLRRNSRELLTPHRV